jgi:hypothetical protein
VYTLVASTFWLTLDAHVLRKLIDVDLRYLQRKKYTRLHIALGWGEMTHAQIQLSLLKCIINISDLIFRIKYNVV